MNAFAEALKARRISQSDVAKKLKVTPGLVSQWAKGRRPVAPEQARKLEKLYGIPAKDISPRLAALTTPEPRRTKKRAVA